MPNLYGKHFQLGPSSSLQAKRMPSPESSAPGTTSTLPPSGWVQLQQGPRGGWAQGAPSQVFALTPVPNWVFLWSPPQRSAYLPPGQAVSFFFFTFLIILYNPNRLLCHKPFRFDSPSSASWGLQIHQRSVAMISQSYLHNLSKSLSRSV